MKPHNGIMAEVIFAPVHPELKRAIGRKADELGLAMNELVARVLADYLHKPELAAIPRKRLGRPRKVT